MKSVIIGTPNLRARSLDTYCNKDDAVIKIALGENLSTSCSISRANSVESKLASLKDRLLNKAFAKRITLLPKWLVVTLQLIASDKPRAFCISTLL